MIPLEFNYKGPMAIVGGGTGGGNDDLWVVQEVGNKNDDLELVREEEGYDEDILEKVVKMTPKFLPAGCDPCPYITVYPQFLPISFQYARC